MSAPDLHVEGLDAAYGASQVLFGVKLEVERGDTLALMGRNGAGKSSTFKAIMGLLPPRAGQVRVRGRDVTGEPPYRIARAGLGFVPEDRQVFPDHTVEENLEIAERGGAGGKAWTARRAFEVLPLLDRLRKRMAGRLSGGEQQMLTIARSLMGNPAGVLLLDEPSEGLAPLIVQEIGKLIRTLREMGTTIVLAEQNSRFCLAVATKVAVIDKGMIVWRGSVEQFRAEPDIQARYLQV